ncbi:phosphate signaling complex protein PhoU [Phenylobacterium soli]|uniref:Phosphate-specific transport system accessory protein PhoU n=1 Tax=Phenylobacterium soli TaxID=2170551 RepID=A0A328AN54_9CAUL|nr:phosphate signaling complex protein PhoU [Phenylobacterium soli]RAK55987.1 phosphate transport system regulatory protein PhoU [Phenylobacterium soli]
MEHTFKAVDEQLQGLFRDVGVMGDLAVAQLRGAVTAFVANDTASAAAIAAGDARLDEMDADIERRAVRFIALHQPMADDLRAPITAMKTAMNLERCGDLAKNLAKRTAQQKGPPSQAQAKGLTDLGMLVADRLAEVMIAYRNADAGKAKVVWERDTDIDELHEKVFRHILTDMSGDPKSIEASTDLLFITKNLERVGDHATNIAELIYYQATGEELSDRPKAG